MHVCDGGGEDRGSHNLYLYYVQSKSYFKQVIMVSTDNNKKIEISNSILFIQHSTLQQPD